jgi:hypothetical protein
LSNRIHILRRVQNTFVKQFSNIVMKIRIASGIRTVFSCPPIPIMGEHTEDPRTIGITNEIDLSVIVFLHDPEEPISAINCVSLPDTMIRRQNVDDRLQR